ncbi:MAG: YfhO family protein, partial [Chloroflexota bacterium]
FSVNGSYNFQKPTPPTYFPDTPLTRALQNELQSAPLARVASEGLLPGGHNAGAEYGFADINGNDPLRLDATEQFDQRVPELRKFQLLGVQYVVTKRTITHGAFTPITSDGDAHLYRFNDALPRAWLIHGARVVPSEKTLDALNDAAFDPTTTAILQRDPPLALPRTAPSDDDVTITQQGAGHLAVRARSTANGLLVVSEIFYPGWRATVDGQSAQLMPADGILMAVAVPSGDHNVVLTFAPDLVTIGAAISGLSLLLFFVLLIVARR